MNDSLKEKTTLTFQSKSSCFFFCLVWLSFFSASNKESENL